MSGIGMVPTPIFPGVNVDANEGDYIISVCIAMIALSFVAVALRFFSRWWTAIALGIDDYLIIVSVAISWTFSIIVIVQVKQNYFGQHVGKSDIPHIVDLLRSIYILSLIYLPAITTSKLSLLALYWRAFAESKGKWPVIIAAGINILWMVVVSFLAAFSCNPVRGFWDITIERKCLRLNDLFIATEAFTIGLDVIVLLMPLYFIKSIKRSLSQRISISSTFLIGLVVTIISCIRLYKLVKSSQRPGFDTYNQIDAGTWGSMELNIWVVVASIPALRPLFMKLLKKTGTGTRATGASRTYVNESSRGMKARFGVPRSTTAFSLNSRDDRTSEDCNTLVYAKPSAGENGSNNPSYNNYELNNVSDAEHGIRVDQEVNISVRDKARQPLRHGN